MKLLIDIRLETELFTFDLYEFISFKRPRKKAVAEENRLQMHDHDEKNRFCVILSSIKMSLF